MHLSPVFRGCVIGPTFNFNVSELNFGDVAFGEFLFFFWSVVVVVVRVETNTEALTKETH